MTQNEKGLQHEMEHKATIEQIIADAKAGNAKPVEHYIQQMADTHISKLKDYYDRLENMEHEGGETADGEGEEHKPENETPEEKDERRVSRAYESVKPKPAEGATVETDKAAAYTEK